MQVKILAEFLGTEGTSVLGLQRQETMIRPISIKYILYLIPTILSVLSINLPLRSYGTLEHFPIKL